MDAIANAIVAILASVAGIDDAPHAPMCFEAPTYATSDCMFVHEDSLFEVRPDGRVVILAYV